MLGEAETDASTKCLRSAQGDPGILDVPRVAHAVTRVLECRPGEGHVVAVLGPQTAGQRFDRRGEQVDDFIAGQVIRWRKSLELQEAALASVPMPKAARTAAVIRSRAWWWVSNGVVRLSCSSDQEVDRAGCLSTEAGRDRPCSGSVDGWRAGWKGTEPTAWRTCWSPRPALTRHCVMC